MASNFNAQDILESMFENIQQRVRESLHEAMDSENYSECREHVFHYWKYMIEKLEEEHDKKN